MLESFCLVFQAAENDSDGAVVGRGWGVGIGQLMDVSFTAYEVVN